MDELLAMMDGKSGGKGGKGGVKRAADDTSKVVFVRGFDFGTTDEQLNGHMSTAGTIENVNWLKKGEVEITYSTPEEAQAAVSILNSTTIDGNTRYIEVKISLPQGDPKRFVSKGWGKEWGKEGKGAWGKGAGN